MRRKLISRLSLLTLVTVMAATGAMAQTLPMELEVGYRWSHVNGNEDMYRSQINERAGFLVRSFTLSTNDPNGVTMGFVDRFRVDVSELGVGPAGFARLDMGKTGVYRLTLGYRETDQYSALPGFANPLLAQGIIPGQHTIDRTRKMFDADLELLPGKAITPFVGYSWNRNSGPGQTTYFLGQDEFRLNQNLKETENEVRVGAGFNFGGVVYGQVTQGWRQFKGTETLSLVPGGGAGNNPGPILDQPISASSINRTGNTDVNTPFTNVNVTAAIAKRFKVTGTYIQFNAKQDGLGSESDAGSFTSFQLDRFFSGLTESVSANAENKTWQGGGRVELGLTEGVDLFGGFNRQHRDLSGTSLIDTIYLQSITFGGLDKKDLEVLLNTQNSMTRQDDVWNVGLSARSVGPLSFRGEYRETDGQTTMTPDLSEIVVGSIVGQGGTLDRRVRTLDGSVTFTQSGFTALAAYKKDKANAPVFRTDYLDRDRVRGRIGYTTPGDLIKLGFQLEQTNQSNDWTGTGFSAKSRQYTGDLEIAPVPALRLRGSVSEFQTDSTIVYRVPQNLNLDNSINTEHGDAYEGGLSLKLSPLTLDMALGRLENRGTNPFNIDRYRLNLGCDIVKQVGIVAEWARDKYREGTPSLGDFDATRFGLYLRWRP